MAESGLDFTSSLFNPLKALYTDSLQPPVPNVQIFNNINEYAQSLKSGNSFPKRRIQTDNVTPRGSGSDAEKSLVQRLKNIADNKVRSRNRDPSRLSHLMKVKSKTDGIEEKVAMLEKTKKRPKQKNVLERMEDQYKEGPLSILYNCIEKKMQLRVWTRRLKGLRGVCVGYLIAFDKHMNLAMMDVDEMFAIEEEVETDPTITARRMDKKKEKKRNWRKKKRINLRTNWESNHDFKVVTNTVVRKSIDGECSGNGDQEALSNLCKDEVVFEFNLNMRIPTSDKDTSRVYGTMLNKREDMEGQSSIAEVQEGEKGKIYENEQSDRMEVTKEGLLFYGEMGLANKNKGVVTDKERLQGLEYGSLDNVCNVEQEGKDESRRNPMGHEKVQRLDEDNYSVISSDEEGISGGSEGKRTSSSDEEGILRIAEDSWSEEGDLTTNVIEIEAEGRKDGSKKERQQNRTKNVQCHLCPDLVGGLQFEIKGVKTFDPEKTLPPNNDSRRIFSSGSLEPFENLHSSKTNNPSALSVTDDEPSEQCAFTEPGDDVTKLPKIGIEGSGPTPSDSTIVVQESPVTKTEFVASMDVEKPTETKIHAVKKKEKEVRSTDVDACESSSREGKIMESGKENDCRTVDVNEGNLGEYKTNSEFNKQEGDKTNKNVISIFEKGEQVGTRTPIVKNSADASSSKVEETEIATAELVVSEDVLKTTGASQVKNVEKEKGESSEKSEIMITEEERETRTVESNIENLFQHKASSELDVQTNDQDKEVIGSFETGEKISSVKPSAKITATDNLIHIKEIRSSARVAELSLSKDDAKLTDTSKVKTNEKEEGELTSSEDDACASSLEEGEIISSEKEREVMTGVVDKGSLGKCKGTTKDDLEGKTKLRKTKKVIIAWELARGNSRKQLKNGDRQSLNERSSPKNFQEKTSIVVPKSDGECVRSSRKTDKNTDQGKYEYSRSESKVRNRSEKIEEKGKRSIHKYDREKEQKREQETSGSLTKEKVGRTGRVRQGLPKTTGNGRTSSSRRERSVDRKKDQARQKDYTGKQNRNIEADKRLSTSADGVTKTRKTSREEINKETLRRDSCSTSSKPEKSNAKTKTDVVETGSKTASGSKPKIAVKIAVREGAMGGRKVKDLRDYSDERKYEKDSGKGRKMETLAKIPSSSKDGQQMKKRLHGKHDCERNSTRPTRNEKSEVTSSKKISEKNLNTKHSKVPTDKLASSKKDVNQKPFNEATSKVLKGTCLEKDSITLKQSQNNSRHKAGTSGTSKLRRDSIRKSDIPTDNSKSKRATSDKKSVNQNREGKETQRKSFNKKENECANDVDDKVLNKKRSKGTRNKGLNNTGDRGVKKLDIKSNGSGRPQQVGQDSEVKISGKRPRDHDGIERPSKVRKVGKDFAKPESPIKIKETKLPGKVVTVRVLKVERGMALVLKRRHVNQLFVRGDNVVMVAYENTCTTLKN